MPLCPSWCFSLPQGAPIKYLVLEDTDEIIALVEDKIKGEQIQEDEDESDNNDQGNAGVWNSPFHA